MQPCKDPVATQIPPARTWAHREGSQEHKCYIFKKQQRLITQLYACGSGNEKPFIGILII